MPPTDEEEKKLLACLLAYLPTLIYTLSSRGVNFPGRLVPSLPLSRPSGAPLLSLLLLALLLLLCWW